VSLLASQNIPEIAPKLNRTACIRYRSPTLASALSHDNGKAASADLKREALAAWRKFVSCIKALPSDQIGPLLEQAFEQAAAMAHC
jgi:hypothetical protein